MNDDFFKDTMGWCSHRGPEWVCECKPGHKGKHGAFLSGLNPVFWPNDSKPDPEAEVWDE